MHNNRYFCQSMRKAAHMLLTFLLVAIPAAGQGDFADGQATTVCVGKRSLLRRVGDFLDTMAVKGLDRRYIEAPRLPWQLIMKGNINQTDLKLQSRVNGEAMFSDVVGDLLWEPRIKTVPSTYAGLWVGYRGYGLGYSWNLGGDKGRILTLGATGGSYGVNLRLHSFENDEPEVRLAGNIILDDDPDTPAQYIEESLDYVLFTPIKAHTLMLDAYYLFNGRHFSYAAAYDQSVIQKRSAGSFMAGMMYYHSRIDYATDDNADFVLFMDDIGSIRQWQLSLGAGYAYNLVPCRGLLVSIMAMPMLTVIDMHKTWRYDSNFRRLLLEGTEDEEEDLPFFDWHLSEEPMSVKRCHGRVTTNFDARLSVTYQLGRFFLNAYGQFSSFHYRDGDVTGRLNDWYVNTAVGIRF